MEIIIKQMLKWRRIEDVGDTSFIPDQIVEKWRFEEENAKVAKEGGKMAKALAHLLPISRAALAYDSFISAAAFQETTRVLTDAATRSKRDELRSLKENVIMGHLISAGTGLNEFKHMAVEDPADEDSDIIEGIEMHELAQVAAEAAAVEAALEMENVAKAGE